MSRDPSPKQVRIAKQAQKGIRDLPDHSKAACKQFIRDIAMGRVSGKKLKGQLSGLRSIRIGRGHRLVYRDDATVVEVVAVGPRGDVYK